MAVAVLIETPATLTATRALLLPVSPISPHVIRLYGRPALAGRCARPPRAAGANAAGRKMALEQQKKDAKRTHRSGLALSKTRFFSEKRTQTNPTSNTPRPRASMQIEPRASARAAHRRAMTLREMVLVDDLIRCGTCASPVTKPPRVAAATLCGTGFPAGHPVVVPPSPDELRCWESSTPCCGSWTAHAIQHHRSNRQYETSPYTLRQVYPWVLKETRGYDGVKSIDPLSGGLPMASTIPAINSPSFTISQVERRQPPRSWATPFRSPPGPLAGPTARRQRSQE
jgi:hypothetical protein